MNFTVERRSMNDKTSHAISASELISPASTRVMAQYRVRPNAKLNMYNETPK